MHEVILNGITVGNGQPFLLVAGPCVIESEKMCLDIALRVRDICEELEINYIFKASFDKANRSSLNSFRGPGREQGLRILQKIRDQVGVGIQSDVHSIEDINDFSGVLDVMQIPAFLCRQTDLLVAAAETGKVVNIKKGQFLAPWDVRNIIDKITSMGNHNIIITERGTSFGYNNLVVDFKGLPIIRQFGYPVCFDATHSVQLPGGAGTSSGGQREFVPHLVRAAMAVGVDALFMEVHEDPDNALSDGPNMVTPDDLYEILKNAKLLDKLVKKKKMI
jgi:2-dehydro-3-deoxyphosphooctonate aldolase (KDO 8-P synthase)